MINTNNFLVNVLAKGNQSLDENKQTLVRLTDVLEVVQRLNEEEAKQQAEKTKKHSDKMKEAWAKKKKGTSTKKENKKK